MLRSGSPAAPPARLAAAIRLVPPAVLFLLLILLSALVRAQALPELREAAVRPSDSGSGRLFLRRDDGGFTPAPLIATGVRIAVSGPVARAAVVQEFRNPGDDWVEGIYVFPLPEASAVDRLRLIIGERVIEGEIQERQQAQRNYAAARAAGQRAGLVEQERPNIFTSSVANIGPGERIRVAIEYQETLRWDAGAFHLRFPLVVGPRYVPGEPLVASARGWAAATPAVPDAPRITPPVRSPLEGKGNPVTIEVAIDAGMKLAAVESPSHEIVATETGSGGRIIRLAAAEVPADRDFVLRWTPEAGAAPRAGLFVEERDGARHLLAMIVPPSPDAAAETPRLAREVVFILDTSGSMEGASIRQAKAALLLALDRLAAGDSFEVIEFNSRARALFGRTVPVAPASLARARRWVDALKADGGTEMMPALDLALDGASHPGRVRQVVFLTDGAVGNEEQLYRRIVERLGDSRLFTVGIGSAPNGWFMREAARAGRGTFTNIARIEEVGQRMETLFEKLEKPVMTDLAIAWPAGVAAERHPDPLPDLYAGEPVVFSARLEPGASLAGAAVAIEGMRGATPWRAALALDGGAAGTGVAAVWARSKIDSLGLAARRGERPDGAREAILDVALRYGLVSRFTALVAVDRTPARPPEAALGSAEVPTNLPDGWVHEKVFGRKAAAPGGARFAAAPSATVDEADPAQPLALPQTATDWMLQLAIGLALLGFALALGLGWGWRRP